MSSIVVYSFFYRLTAERRISGLAVNKNKTAESAKNAEGIEE